MNSLKKSNKVCHTSMVIAGLSLLFLTGCKKSEQVSPTGENAQSATARAVTTTSVTAGPPYKVAYYAFDNGSVSLLQCTQSANVMVLFEGTPWQIVDSTHYDPNHNGIMLSNQYKSYKAIMADVRTLQARGVKVLMNIDDAASWSTTTPFTNSAGTKLTYTQFAAFVKQMVIESLHLDGIALDIEHGATVNTNYNNMLKALGGYFGPKSSNTSTIYTAAIYSGAPEGDAIGKKASMAAYFNFVEDMGYFSDNTSRFNQYAKYIGNAKTMIGVSSQYNSLANAEAAAAWQPPTGDLKAGIMVYAANGAGQAYTDSVFAHLSVKR
ncbi:EndoS/ChiA family endoglycosidase [Mucilaginibacter sp. 22184]|uniref:EndoS/ChiA family endoglycosidase n=1 Tax=Mucilaginibacter sp. 22184 TaxID=3453887 RepID=UPI003F852E38